MLLLQVTALVKLKECEDTHLGEEVDRNWAEVVTQQYVFDRLNREVNLHTYRLHTYQGILFFFYHANTLYLFVIVVRPGRGSEADDPARPGLLVQGTQRREEP